MAYMAEGEGEGVGGKGEGRGEEGRGEGRKEDARLSRKDVRNPLQKLSSERKERPSFSAMKPFVFVQSKENSL
ncbi:hypothetical protein, partial [Enterococcus faecalis]|uniref:hypothetical protein n=1 Tax=Enterococcus faecalis TaxID=1351 RepID=UPI00403FB74A